MSTPLGENTRRYNHSPLLSPGSSRLVKNRYCVSDTSFSNSKILNGYSPGPLLTPTNYNTSLSTYIDCKSPGFSGRIVQYNDNTVDRTEPFFSHQAKYGSPGLFPIVHLAKKRLPVRKLQRDAVRVRLIATPDSPNYNLQSNGLSNGSEVSDTSTSSVLRALREISKKRALSEDITLQCSNNKRQRSDCQIDVSQVAEDLSKNAVDDIPCVVDALAASLTSSNTSLVKPRNVLKRQSTNTSLEVASVTPSPKQIRREVETQTDILKINSDTQTIDEDTKSKDDIPDVHTNALKDKVSSRLFALTGDKPTSILSPVDKQKHDKHVTFNLVDDTTENSVVTTTALSSNQVDLTTTPAPASTTEVVVTTAATVLPPLLQSIITSSPPKLDISIPNITTSMFMPPTTSLSLPTLSSPSVFTPPSLQLPFISTSNKIQENVLATSPPASTAAPSVELKFGFTSQTTIPSQLPFGFIPTTQPKLALPVSSSPLVSVSTVASTSFNPLPTPTTIIFTPVATAISLPFGLSYISQQALLNSKPKMAVTVVPSGFASQTEPKSPSNKPLINFGVNSPPMKPGGFKFDFGGVSSVNNSAVTKLEPTFNFGSPTVSTVTNFGANTTVTSAFGASSISSTGIESKSSNIGFSLIKSDAKSTFGSPGVSTVPQVLSTDTKMFAVPAFNTSTQSATNLNSFKFGPVSTIAPTPDFSTSDSSMFQFGGGVTTAAPAFKAPDVSTSIESNKFGVNVMTPPSIFQSSTIGAPRESNTFGVTATPIFKVPGIPTSNTSNKFGNTVFKPSPTFTVKQPPSETASFKFTPATAAPSFPVAAFNTIQSPPESTVFKFGGATTNIPASIFNKPFDTSGPSQNEFKFGGSATTTAPAMFSPPAFGTPTDTSISKAPPLSFPTTTASFNSFGSFEPKTVNPFNPSGFGDSKNAAPFGTNQGFGAENKAASIFGAAPQNQSTFGSFNNIQAPFGAVAPPIQTAPSQPFQFGAPANNVFSFGASSEPAKPAAPNVPSSIFAFGANTTNNAFGSTPAPFGAPLVTPSNFGMQAPAVANFGTSVQSTPMFSIGTGSLTPKTRTQLKARRRT